MTYLLLQTFLLLLAAYFAGAFTACVAKRWLTVDAAPRLVPALAPQPMAPSAPQVPMSPAAAAAAAAARAVQRPQPPRPFPAPQPQPRIEVKPRAIELVQPKIDLFPRPQPRGAPTIADTYRFERALVGPDPNEGVPRVPIMQLRPAVYSWVTGPPGPWPPPKKPEPAPSPELDVDEREPQIADMTPPAAAASAPSPVETRPRPGITSAAANAAAAASAAMAAARNAAAAAAAAIGSVRPAKPVEPATDTAPVEKTQAAPADPIAAPVAAAPVVPVRPMPNAAQQVIAEGDDLQRIRAIDAATEQALKRRGVTRFETMAHWTPGDIDRLDDDLDLHGRIDIEQWVEQAQILAKGGETYYSRNRAAAARAAATEQALPKTTSAPLPAPAASADEDETSYSDVDVEGEDDANSDFDAMTDDDDDEAEAFPPAASPVVVAAATQSRPGQGGRSVAEIAAAAAAAIAAASASVTRGIRPIEPLSPISKVDPNIKIPAKLSDAIREKETQGAAQARQDPPAAHEPDGAPSLDDDGEVAFDDGDDLKRIRGIGVLIEKRLKTLGVATYDMIANWTNEDIDYFSQQLDFKGRIERESWVEQARILSSGGDTEFSGRVDRGEVDSSKDG